MIKTLQKYPLILYATGGILLIIALLINLGRINIFMAVDEATRGLVALEMMISGNYVTPTIYGDFYYNKPPLFPWILVVFFKLFGMSEMVLRLPTVLSLIGFGFTIYYFVSLEMGKQAGIITAFLFVTLGRLLFWESLLGYIDTTFSWVIYTMLMVVIYHFRRKQYLKLFLLSYLLMTVGYMLKGLPAIVFQGITLLVVFISEKEWRRLFSWQHVAGAGVFVVLAGGYYLMYHQYNSLQNVFATLWSESTNRTVATQGVSLTLQHLYKFPVEMLYHYLPWTLLLVFTLVRGFWKKVFQNSFLKLSLLVLLFNLIPYWTSPDVYPKYIMMLVPLALTIFVFFYLENKKQNKRLSSIMEWVFFGAGILLTIGYLALPLIPQFADTPAAKTVATILFVLSAILMYFYFYLRDKRLIIFAIVLIVGRIAFGWYVWPLRAEQFEVYEEDAIEVAQITADKPLLYYHAPMLQYGATYVMTREKQQLIRQEKQEPKPGVFYITDDDGLALIRQENQVEIFYQYPNVEDGRNLNLIKIMK